MINKKEKIKKNERKIRKELRKTGFYYSFLTIVLVLCLIIMGYSLILNITKLVSYKAKMITMEKALNEAEEYNKDLKEEIKVFSSTPNLEGIARNTLKMAGEDEVLIIINSNPNTSDRNKKKSKKRTVINDVE